MTSRSIPLEERFWDKAERGPGCWLWQAARDARGYGLIAIGRKNHRAHRIAYVLTHGPIPDDLVVRHTCDTPACINPAHLVLGTQLDNIADRNERGRTASGDRAGARTHPERYPGQAGSLNPRAKLDEAKVEEIRRRYDAGGISDRKLAREYGVSRRAIRLLLAGETWNKKARPS